MAHTARTSMLGRVVRTQFLVTVAAGTLGFVHGPVAGFSALWGGLACAVPSAFFGRRVFEKGGVAEVPSAATGRLIRAEVVKIALTVLMLVSALVAMPDISIVALLGAYALVHIGGTGAALTAAASVPSARLRRTERNEKKDSEHE